MKRFFILMVFAAGLLTGCDQIDPTQRQEEDCWITLRPSGEITSSEGPITKASTDDLYFVQIYRGSSPFAFGIFDDVEKMIFNLQRGSDKYRIVVSLLRNGKTALGSDFDEQNQAINSNYKGNTYSIQKKNSSNNIYWKTINDIYYNSVGIYRHRNGTETGDYNLNNINIAQIQTYKYYKCEDWLYSEITNYSPNGDFETLNVDLKRVGFKLKYELSGVTDGEVTVTIANSDKTFFQETVSSATYESATKFYAFYEARNAWLYADNYSENLTVSVSWLRGIGVRQDLGSTTVQVLRNCLNNIKITLGSDDRSAGMSLSVEPESSIGSSAVTIPLG